VPVRACGVEKLYNVLTNLRSDGGLQRTNQLLGTTRFNHRDTAGDHVERLGDAADVGDLVLDQDAVAAAMRIASLRAPAGCKSFDIVDTAFLRHGEVSQAPGAKGRDMPPWLENWTTQTCDVETVVLMTFLPHPIGTTITATTGRKPK